MHMFQMRRMLLQSKGLDLGQGLRFLLSNLKRKSVHNKIFHIFKMNESMTVKMDVLGKKVIEFKMITEKEIQIIDWVFTNLHTFFSSSVQFQSKKSLRVKLR